MSDKNMTDGSTTDDLGGKAKEAIGGVAGDENLERQGRNDQKKSKLKDAAEDIKDVFKG